jgi:thiol-disulfide isomerase/thioredoxin
MALHARGAWPVADNLARIEVIGGDGPPMLLVRGWPAPGAREANGPGAGHPRPVRNVPEVGSPAHREGKVMTAHWPVPAGLHTASARLPVEGELPSLAGATGWLNSPPLTMADLRGNVVLVNFWTYTCINWLRQLPYVRAWAGNYSGQGLVVVGVHTPEFPFEQDPDNVSRAVREMRIEYPVAIDNDYAVWSAFDNHYWPALYFADAQGQIRHHQFGEGEYQQSKMVLQQLLAEAGSADPGHDLVSVDARGVEAPADWDSLWSPENYLGFARTGNFASAGGAVLGRRHAYTPPAELGLNHWALSGDWTMEEQATTLNTANGQIVYRFHARDLHLVMAPTTPGGPVRFRVRIDEQPPGAAHGADVDDQGNGTVADQRLHQLIRQPGPIADRTFEITFLDPGVQAYSFTFG